MGQTPDHFVFDVKLHRLLSRHAAKLQELPPDLRDGVEVSPRGRVKLTDELEAAVIDELKHAVEPLDQAGKLRAFLLQLTPAFAPGKNELGELDALLERLAPHPVAVEFRHRGWVRGDRAEQTLSYLSEHRAAFVGVDAPQEDHIPIMPAIDAVTRDDLAYLRLHGRNAEGYLHGQERGRALRLALLGRGARAGGRARARPGRAGGGGARAVQQQPRRRRAHRGAHGSRR